MKKAIAIMSVLLLGVAGCASLGLPRKPENVSWACYRACNRACLPKGTEAAAVLLGPWASVAALNSDSFKACQAVCLEGCKK